MTLKLFVQAVTKTILGIVLTGVMLFLPAGTYKFTNAYIFMGVLFVPVVTAGILLMFKKPELLKKRLNSKEKQQGQKSLILACGVMFVLGFIICGVDFRFCLSDVPHWLVVLSCILFLACYAVYGEVIRENAYLSRIIEVQENQKVIDTGLYGIVRHPMYLATVIMFLLIPIILGSFVALPVFCIYPFVIVKRIKFEENLLEQQLLGYVSYMQKVKWRLLPYIW